MSIKTIMVPVTSTEAATPALDTAFDVANLFGAQIIGLHVRPHPNLAMPHMMPPMPMDYVRESADAIVKAGRERAAELRNFFHDACAKRQVPVFPENELAGRSETGAAWREKEGFVPDDIGVEARTADLIVVAQAGEDAWQSDRDMVEAVLLVSGHPVLIVPKDGSGALTRNAVIAWNGSAEASQAVSAALPFLERADKVTVLTVGNGAQGAPDAEDTASFLARHGIEADTDFAPADDQTVGEALLDVARERGAGLIVMGAYSHSRLREMVFGGVTRDMLNHADRPVLMTH